jgi:hypothetical protein
MQETRFAGRPVALLPVEESGCKGGSAAGGACLEKSSSMLSVDDGSNPEKAAAGALADAGRRTRACGGRDGACQNACLWVHVLLLALHTRAAYFRDPACCVPTHTKQL